jgi:hypothetical protein
MSPWESCFASRISRRRSPIITPELFHRYIFKARQRIHNKTAQEFWICCLLLFCVDSYLSKSSGGNLPYNHHVRLLSPEPAVVDKPQSTRVEEPTLSCNQVQFPLFRNPRPGVRQKHGVRISHPISPRQPLTWVCRWPSVRGGRNRDSKEWVDERLGTHTGRFRGAVDAAASLFDCEADNRW